MFRKVRKIHFVGIGGAGMSGIAELLLNLNFEVSGSDIKDSPVVERLRKFGAKIEIGHRPENLGEAEVVVYSSAVPLDNPELSEARRRGIPVIPRAEMLAELMRMKEGIAVAGSHGKTTITSLLASILAEAGLDPTAVIGGKLEKFGGGARLGQGQYIVAEADESDGSFLLLSPMIVVVTNIDPEHLDHYGTFERLKDAFASFVNRIPFYGVAILGIDSIGVCDILHNIKKPFVTYGFSYQADYQVRDYEQNRDRVKFVAYSRKDGELANIEFGMPGKHHAANALASFVVARNLDVPTDVICRAIKDFSGLHRRFEILGEFKGVIVVDDYGHHPREIESVLNAARAGWPERRLVVVFQPHRYTRTRALYDEFLKIFHLADVLVGTEIYPASEKPIAGVTGEKLFSDIAKHGQREVVFVEERTNVAKEVRKITKPGDMVVFVGAGDIWQEAKKLIELL